MSVRVLPVAHTLLLAACLLAACADNPSSAAPNQGPSSSNHGNGNTAPNPSTTEPAFYSTPAVVGAGVRIARLQPGATPTLRQAIDALKPGDVIELGAGTYRVSGGSLRVRTSGTPQHWIVIRATPNTRPVIDLQASGEFNVAASYVLIEGLEIKNGSGNNLHVAPTTKSISHVIIRNCRVHSLARGSGAAIKVNSNVPAGALCTDIYLENNDVANSINNAVIDGVGVRRAVVRDNDIHDPQRGSHGLFFKGGSSEVLFEGNLIRGVRGNAALQLGGNTGARYFDPLHPDREAVDIVARNNLIVDCDDSVFEIRGVLRGTVAHNTVVTQTGFAIFRLSYGNSASGARSGNDELLFANNLVVSTANTPQYARNDANAGQFDFGPQLWVGTFRNAGVAGPGIPRFPSTLDRTAALSRAAQIIATPSFTGLSGRSDALTRYAPVRGSLAFGGGIPLKTVPRDIAGTRRSTTKPTLGAFE